MRLHPVLALLLCPLLVSAQSSNASAASQNVQLSTSLSTFITLGPNSAQITTTSTAVFTVNPASASGNATASGNSTASGNATSSTPSPTSNLPTAPTDVDGGGNGGAPVPGATGAGGAYGPGDGYTAAAVSLRKNALVGALFACVMGAVFVGL